MSSFKPDDPGTAAQSLSSDAVLPLDSGKFTFLNPARQADEIGRIGEYRVLRVLGSGGMGVVFEAEDTTLRRLVAIKVLRSELAVDAENRERFLRESRAAAGLRSEHVVTIYHVGVTQNVPYLVMEFLHGFTLQERLHRQAPLQPAAALTIARQVALGLEAAHAFGFIHRDIKPANLWLETDGHGGPFKRVRILDFGLARRSQGEPSLTNTGFIVGTPNYMAPEQASGFELDPRADLFSLGAVIYTMLTGELPFPGKSAMAVMMALASTEPTPIAVKNPKVPLTASALVSKLLSKNPAARPQSAHEVVLALDAILAKMPSYVPTPPVAIPLSSIMDVAPSAETVVPTMIQTVPHETPSGPVSPGRRWSTPSRRAVLRAAGGTAALAGLGTAAWLGYRAFQASAGPIKVGVLHSQSGTLAVSEEPIIGATLLAIEELNRQGGVLQRSISPVVVDGKSDPRTFAMEAERLIRDEQILVIFGCWSSAARKAVRTVVERANNLLFYPVQCEGLEESPRVVYLGPVPNQQLIPGVDYLTGALGKRRLFLIGSDYVFPRAAHAIVKDHLKSSPGVEVVGEEYVKLGANEVGPFVDRIQAVQPDAILNTINGSTNYHFFRELRREGFTPGRVPTMSVSIAENELRALDPAVISGDYLAASYFQGVERDENRAFITRFQARYGTERPTTDGMAAAYTGVMLWAKAAKQAGRIDPDTVVESIRDCEYAGPSGLIRIDPANRHAWRPWRIGRIRPDGSVEIVAGVQESVRPEPFPKSRTRAEWDRFLNDLHARWGGQWQAPTS